MINNHFYDFHILKDSQIFIIIVQSGLKRNSKSLEYYFKDYMHYVKTTKLVL